MMALMQQRLLHRLQLLLSNCINVNKSQVSVAYFYAEDSMKKKLFVFPIVLTLMGCSQKMNDVNETVKTAFFAQDVILSSSQLSQIPYSTMYARIGDDNRALMVLGFAEPSFADRQYQKSNELKWMSADKAMLVTQNGRLIKTRHLRDGNLLDTRFESPDPVSLGLHSTTHLTWKRSIDWQPGYHIQYRMESTFVRQGLQSISVNDVELSLLYVTEHVSVPELALNYNNQFWVDPSTGVVIKTLQRIAPLQPEIEMTFLYQVVSNS